MPISADQANRIRYHSPSSAGAEQLEQNFEHSVLNLRQLPQIDGEQY